MSQNQEKFKTMIGGQALIEGIMMRGPNADAVVVRTKDGLEIDKKARKVYPKKSPLTWPLIRGVVNFFDAQVTGVKALMQSADLSPEEQEENPSKFDIWLEKKLGEKKFKDFLVGTAVAIGLGFMVLLFVLLPNFISSLFVGIVTNNLALSLIEGVIRIVIFFLYMLLVSRMDEIKRVFAYHGAEHKTIRCYEAGLPLTVENVKKQTRKHPRCGTSFLFVVMILSILVFSVGSSVIHALIPSIEAMRSESKFLYSLIMFAFKLLLLPLVVSVSYEINRLVGRYDNWLTKVLTAPGMWFQVFTTNEPDDEMIEVGIAALQAVLPENEGDDLW